MTQTLNVVQAFDRASIAEIPCDDGAALDAKLALASRVLRDRSTWMKPHQRMEIKTFSSMRLKLSSRMS